MKGYQKSSRIQITVDPKTLRKARIRALDMDENLPAIARCAVEAFAKGVDVRALLGCGGGEKGEKK